MGKKPKRKADWEFVMVVVFLAILVAAWLYAAHDLPLW